MTIFMASLKNEIKKIFSRKKYIVFLIIEIIIALISSIISYAIGSMSSIPISTNVTLADLPTSMLSFFIQIYVPLIIFMAACDLYTTEIHDGTARALFMRPVSRFKIFFSKSLAIFLLALVYLITLLIITLVVKCLGTHSVAGVFESFGAYILDACPMIVLILFTSMLNQFTKSPSLSIMMAIVIYVALHLIGVLIPQMSGLLFTGYFEWHTLWLGVTLPVGAMLSKIGILAGYGLLFACVGYYFYERKEV